MKEISELNLPEDVRYTKDHEWAKNEEEAVRIGISDYAQNQLGDIVYVDLPRAGEAFQQGQEFGTVESVKAVSELYMPIGGEVLSVNKALEDAPELVNTDPYLAGWMLTVKPDDPEEVNRLLDRQAYLDILKGTR